MEDPNSVHGTAGIALLTGVANWLYVEPVATNLMFERYALENAEGERDGAKIKALYKTFGEHPSQYDADTQSIHAICS